VFFKEDGAIPTMLPKSRFNRRLHALSRVPKVFVACSSNGWLEKTRSPLSKRTHRLRPGARGWADVRILQAMDLDFPDEAWCYTDSGYTDYDLEDQMTEEHLHLIATRKHNRHRPWPGWVRFGGSTPGSGSRPLSARSWQGEEPSRGDATGL